MLLRPFRAEAARSLFPAVETAVCTPLPFQGKEFEGKQQVARELLRNGFAIEQIMQWTGLPRETVECVRSSSEASA